MIFLVIFQKKNAEDEELVYKRILFLRDSFFFSKEFFEILTWVIAYFGLEQLI